MELVKMCISPTHGSIKIVQQENIGKDDFRLGKTKIFIRKPATLFALEEKREASLPKIVARMQAVWKGYRVRCNNEKRKASSKIARFYKTYKSRKWVNEVVKAFKDVKQDPKYGKNIKWPQAPPVLARAQQFLEQIRQYWAAESLVKTLTPQQRELVRQKIFARDIFKGKKPYELLRKYESDYLGVEKNPNKEKFMQAAQILFNTYGDAQILFADEVMKISRKGKGERRAIVVTEKNMYKHNPKDYKLKNFDGTDKFGIPLADITGISMSPQKDTFVVVHTRGGLRDLVLDLGLSGIERVSEFVTVVAMACEKLKGNKLPIHFESEIKYSLDPKQKGASILKFEHDAKVIGCKFKKGKKNDTVYFGEPELKMPAPLW